MTVQFSQGFSNQCPWVNLKGYSLYYIWQGHPADEGEKHFYQLKSKPDPEKVGVMSACWDGYAGSYQLSAEGSLILTRFHYFLPNGLGESDALLEELHGDFYLEFRTHFEGDQLYVPFVQRKQKTRTLYFEFLTFKRWRFSGVFLDFLTASN